MKILAADIGGTNARFALADPEGPAFDQVAQAMGGGMSITGPDSDHQVRAGIPIGDLGGGGFRARLATPRVVVTVDHEGRLRRIGP